MSETPSWASLATRFEVLVRLGLRTAIEFAFLATLAIICFVLTGHGFWAAMAVLSAALLAAVSRHVVEDKEARDQCRARAAKHNGARP